MNRIFRQKVKGFTVMELMVTMVISGIVVLAAFQFYTIFNKLLLQKNNSMEGGKEVLQFYDVLKNDVATALSLNSSRDGLMLQLPEKDNIQYEFFDEYVVRIQNTMADTFSVKVIDMSTEKDQTTRYDKILTLEIQKNKETFPILLEKIYTNDVLLNTTIFPDK